MSPASTVLAKPAILEAHQKGEIFISPFDERQVNNCSYDVRLGEFFYLEQPTAKGLGVLNPYDRASVEAMWGQHWQAPESPDDAIGVPKGTRFMRIPPGGIALCHTEEFIGGVDNTITTMIKARSSVGRSFVQIAACAGWGDIGYAQRWTLEIKNNSQHRTVILIPGRRIGQIVFMRTTGISEQDLYFQQGKYQHSDVRGKTHAELVAAWKPEMMLPKKYLDRECQVADAQRGEALAPGGQ